MKVKLGDVAYGLLLSIITVTIATVIRVVFLGSLGAAVAFLTFYPAVIIAALFGGIWAGLLSTALSALAADYFLLNPVRKFDLTDPVDILSLTIFVLSCTGISIIIEIMRRSRVDLISHKENLEVLVKTRTVELEREIDERKETEVALRESEQKFHSLFVHMLDGFAFCRMLFDLQGRPDDFIYLEVNDVFTKLTGLTGVVGKPVTKIIPHVKQMNPEIFEIYGRVASTGEPERFESDFKPLGLRLQISAYRPLPGHFVAVFADITERKRAEEALQRHSEELAAANKELESFSYTVSHDLRAPLRVIKGLSDILVEDYSDKFNGDVKDLLKRITASTDKMSALIDDILSLAKISRETMNCRKIDLGPIAESVVNELRQAEPQRNVEIIIAAAFSVFADAQLLRIALTNLIGNAWKYTSRNPSARIEIGAMTTENEHIFFVRDNGTGFPMSLAHKLFEPFQRLHSESQFPGTGIGLATVQKIILRHGGRIWAESEIDKGSTFYFTLECNRRE
jgi:K+-sensing histidine kinase KdpD